MYQSCDIDLRERLATGNLEPGDERILRDDRIDRGLVEYRKCGVRELKRFVKARNLNLPHSGRVKTRRLVAALEKADDEIRFTKFFELPAEVRNMIYYEYFDDLEDLPRLPHQPPLTLASSALRAESLPLYYYHCAFTLSFITNFDSYEVELEDAPMQTYISKATTDLLKRISDQDFARIHYLRLELSMHSKSRYVAGCADDISVATWGTDLSIKAAESAIVNSHLQDTWRLWGIALKSIEEALEPVLGEFQARPAAHKLRKTDVVALNDLIHRGLEATTEKL